MSCSKYASTPETKNLARISRLILGPCADVMRDVLQKEVPIADLSRRVKSWLRSDTRNTLNKSQTDLIFPPSSNTYSGDYSDLDIYLLYTLLRNVTNLPAHSQGWGNDPEPTDRSVSANIERIRLVRNRYYGHVVNKGISDANFQVEFNNIRIIVEDIDGHLGSPKHLMSVDSIKTQTMDPVQEKKWIVKLNSIDSLARDTDQHKGEINKLELQNDQDGNALHLVAFAGDETTFKNMIKNGCDPYSRSSRGSTVLHYACQNGKLNMVRYICDTFPNLLSLDYNDNEGRSPLHWAAESGNIDLLKFLLGRGFDINTRKNDGKTVLHICCMYGKLDMIRYLNEQYSHLLYIKDRIGNNVLHAAAWGGNIDLFKFLVEKGFDINVSSNDGKTVLHLCCMNGELEMCKHLTENNSHLLCIKDRIGNNVLHAAAWGGNIDLFKFLMEKGFDINVSSNDGKTVLHQCCVNGKIDMCEYLVNTYPHLIDVKDNYGENALHAAAWCGNIELLNFLLGKDLDIKTTSNDGRTVLHICCMNGKLDMCKHLTENYSHLLYIKDTGGMDVLHAAACGGNVDLFKFLFEKGFDITTKRFDGKTVLHFCSMIGNLQICKYLVNTFPPLLYIEDNDGINALHDAARCGSLNVFKFLLEKGFDINTRKNDGKTVLHLCCMNGELEMCKYLTENNSRMLYIKDRKGNNVLHAAAWGGNIDLFKFLMEKGFDINVSSNDEKTVLHQCCMSGKLEMCKYLVKTYPHLLYVKDSYGVSVLLAASRGNNIDLLNFLLGKDLDINTTSNDGETVLHICCMNGKLAMCKHLTESYPDLINIKDSDGANVLHAAAWGGNIDLFNFLLRKGFNIITTRGDGKSVLHLCCMNEKLDMCKYLVNTFPQLLHIKDNDGENALYEASWVGNIELFKSMLGKGLKVEIPRNDGKTVLHLCCMNGKLDMCKYLVNTFPHLLNVKDKNQLTALDIAKVYQFKSVSKFLESTASDSRRGQRRKEMHL
ncbi:serine/threonine-protein phosphatase 6 regulatory ankyrin repeat subunit B-like [Saccostrea cucullata]|uniref:serine/threonine-protein phosphatase 6 regulatory ankyrin repeat subunit B-like n=1 Tax=Saccostrea cuccullata TaxID=36930 RepID=UPI002ED3516B